MMAGKTLGEAVHFQVPEGGTFWVPAEARVASGKMWRASVDDPRVFRGADAWWNLLVISDE